MYIIGLVGIVQGKFWSFILVLGIAVFSIMLYFLFSGQDELIEAQVVPRVGAGGEVVIYVDKKGFNPENITVKSGTQVKWVNSDSEPHFVAFTLKSSLDNLTVVNQELKSQDSLSFKFETNGEYAYYDKLGSFAGKVEVK